MRCKNCGKEITEDKIFCNECSKNLKTVSSKDELKELEQLIEEQKKIDDLDRTKELPDLESLVIEKENKHNDNIEEKDDIIEEKPKRITREEKNSKKKETKKTNKKKIIIIISLILILVLAIIIFIFFNKKNEDIPNKINYSDVIKSYGNIVSKSVKEYVKENESVPKWEDIVDTIKYDDYRVSCSTNKIYEDASIYLANCRVNGKKTKYTYGKKQKQDKNAKIINVYKIPNGDKYYYGDSSNSESNLVGSISCDTSDCKFVSAFDKYVIVNENNKYYLYNYESNNVEFGPFNLSKLYSVDSFLANNNKLYAIYYDDNNTNNIYNVELGNTLKNINGTLEFDGYNYNVSTMYKYGYVVLKNNGKYNFVNLKTGNISYSIDASYIGEYIENSKSHVVYINAYNTNNKLRVYNSNGKLLFDGKEYNKFKYINNYLMVSTNTNYRIYDTNLNLKISSKEYNSVIDMRNDFIVVVTDNKLAIVDINDKLLAKFDLEWNSNIYNYNESMSKWDTINSKYGIYILIENINTKTSKKYYYIPSTGEIGKI